MDRFQIHTKCSLGHSPDSSTLPHPLVTFVARGPPSIYFYKLKPHIFQIDNMNGLDQDLDPSIFLSLSSTRGPGPKGQAWNMTYAEILVVVVQGYTINLCAIGHY